MTLKDILDHITPTLDRIDNFVWGPVTICLLVGTGLYLTFRLRLIQIRGFRHSLEVVSGKYDRPEETGDVSHFQALCTALSATIGIGNIAGVATAISWGGPGALFWMWVTAAVGMATKYTCCTLALKYRTINPDGTVSGGPMYYLDQALGQKWLAVLFALFAGVASFGIGCMVQANSVVDGIRNLIGEDWAARGFAPEIPILGGLPFFKVALGLILAGMTGLVIIGGIRRIGRVASYLVPVMCVLYAGGALIILVYHADRIPEAFRQVFYYAFTPVAVGGGFFGLVVQQTIQKGVARGIFSNEAGLGSAPIAHAAARTNEAVRQGYVAMLEPFTDTLVVCTITGLTILVSGVWQVKGDDGRLLFGPGGIGQPAIYQGHVGPSGERAVLPQFKGQLVVADPADPARPFLNAKGEPYPVPTSSTLTMSAFKSVLGGAGRWIVAVSLALFAYSTMIGWSYYGDRSWGYLLGPHAVMPYRWVFCCLIFVGAVGGLQLVWTLADILNACMAFPNLIGLIFLAGIVVRETRDYQRRMAEAKTRERTR